ncbi:MAG: hypothetical protein FWB76_07345, partial [Oscillospiraceae bacterium]|nr:hypothetical protein [Oscillospiraceae bacterium]
MHYFREELTGCASWEQVFQCMDAWAPLIRHIFMRENLPFTAMAHMTEGTNVVFRVGDYVAKVFAPPASGFDTGVDYDAEVFGLRLAQSHGICAPKCIATGRVCDKYDFDYIIMDYVPGQDLHFAHAQLTEQEKFNIGQQLRAFSDKLNRPCEEFRPIHARRNWSRARQFTMCPPSFQAERAAYLATHQ